MVVKVSGIARFRLPKRREAQAGWLLTYPPRLFAACRNTRYRTTKCRICTDHGSFCRSALTVAESHVVAGHGIVVNITTVERSAMDKAVAAADANRAGILVPCETSVNRLLPRPVFGHRLGAEIFVTG